MADQLTTVSTDQIVAFFGELSTNDIEQLEAAVRLHLGL